MSKRHPSDAFPVLIDSLEDRQLMAAPGVQTSALLLAAQRGSFGRSNTVVVPLAVVRAAQRARLQRPVTDTTTTSTSTDSAGNTITTTSRVISRAYPVVSAIASFTTVKRVTSAPAASNTVNTNPPANLGPIFQGTGVGGVSAFNVVKFVK